MLPIIRYVFPAYSVLVAPIVLAQTPITTTPPSAPAQISEGDSSLDRSVTPNFSDSSAAHLASVNSGVAADNPIPDPVQKLPPAPRPDDFNRYIYYRNRLEFSEDMGVFPVNIPFPFDFMMHDSYGTYPLKYVLVPTISSLRWEICNLQGPSFLRGNWEVDFSGAFVWIPSGPETRYIAYLMGMRRNFVPRNWRTTPYFDWRIGLGDINAKGPLGIAYAQGQDFTFTLNMGAGVRHNFSPRSGMTFGVNWMHISNANLSQGTPPNWGVRNYGINVVGPIFGVDYRLSAPRF